jgi:tetratricopeptide (TPR) repeat protein
VEVRSLLGMFKVKRKRWAEAEAEFATALEDAPDDLVARKGLGTSIMFQRRYEEAAGHLETVRGADPKQDDVYMTLFHIYRQLRDTEKATRVLEKAIRHLPGTEVARRAADRLKEIEEDPEAWAKPEMSLEELVSGLDSPDESVVLKTLLTMQTMKWELLPEAVYRLLKPDVAGTEVRRQAVRLIGAVRDPRTLTILEIKLYHPRERDSDAGVRQETLEAVASLPTQASLFILWEALHEDDVLVREAAVKGLARRTGKWFRVDLDKPTPANLWPDELARYEAWWKTGAASLSKRKAVADLSGLYAHIRDRDRIAGYLLHALDDRNPKTWRAGYDVFRVWTFTSFLADDEVQDVPLATRQQVAADARKWYDERMGKKTPGDQGEDE